MPLKPRSLLLSLLAVPGLAAADVPRVAVDIPPVQSLAAQVMGDLGTPALVIQPGASPHGYSLRPSEAATLDRADVVFWVGDALTPWLANSLSSLAADATTVELLDAPGLVRHDVRESATFAAHDHDHGEDHAHDHDHADTHEAAHQHHHDGLDPHAWLDPRNAQAWLTLMADTLAEADPEHAETYRDNAQQARAALDDLIADVERRLEAAGEPRFIVFHDAYQYFERRFGVPAAGAISLGDASDPSPARIRRVQEQVSALDVQCVFTEPQFNPDLVRSVFGDLPVDTSESIDPLGIGHEPGPGLYAGVIEDLADGLSRCAAP